MGKTIFAVTAAATMFISWPCGDASACTNFLITKGATADGSTMITYAADSHELYGELVIIPAMRHEKGAKRIIWEWDTGKRLGEIDEVPETYRVVGNINEFQVSIGETTYGGRKELQDQKAVLDYGSLMYIALQRSKTAREAVIVMGDLVSRYGYCSEGESFSIADPLEVWFMDMIGKGPGEKGAVWVARRVPDGYISAHANQARIRKFPLHDKKNCLYAPDVISFARKKGFFKGKDEEFSFADTYAPLTFIGLRICEARVYSLFRRVAPSAKLSPDWVMGDSSAKPLPLWIKPDHKLSVQDVMGLMRDHFEGTPMDLNKGVGAGPYNLPYRWRQLEWEVDGVKYFNERSTSTQQTGFSFIAQARSFLPDPIGGLLWFGVDDTFSSVYVPMYSGIRKAPHAFAVGTADFETFSWDSAFWVFNAVANLAYSRYRDMIKDIQVVQAELEGGFLARQADIERAAVKLYQQAPELARDYLTSYSSSQAARVVARWQKLWPELFLRYLDGNVRDEHGKVTHPGYPESWYRRIIKDSGDFYKERRIPGEPEPEKKKKAPEAQSGDHNGAKQGCPPCADGQQH
jgi:dipeptidase